MNARLRAALSLLLAALASTAGAVTTIQVTGDVAVPDVRRFGIDLAQVNYYDSCQYMKELLFRNPGFEGLLFQSVVRLGSGIATQAVEDAPWTQWPSGFWDGAAYEVIWGAAAGRTGIVAHSMAPNRATLPNDPAGSTNGTTYVFADSGAVPGAGDMMVLRKTEIGGEGGGAAFEGWTTNATGGATFATETSDLPPGTEGRQCVRVTATNSGQNATLTGSFDTWNGVSFVQLNGAFRLVFKGRAAGGAGQVLVTLRRGAGSYWVNSTVQLAPSWQCYTQTFAAAENGTAVGPVSVQFMVVNQSAVLLDDVSLRRTDGDPANPTEFRDPVVAALRELNPGFIRSPNWQTLGDSLDNVLAPVFGRLRSGYSSYSVSQHGILMGLHEFLVLCETVGADPWFTTPITCSTREMANLMEYFGGPTNTPYGARRAALGHPAPWTDVFRRLHVEFGNESWNGGYRGGNIGDTTAFGNRGSELFGVAKASPYYTGAQYDFILGEQWVVPWRVGRTHNASTNHDSITVAGYMASQIDSFADTEELYGSLFAEPEWWSKPGGLMYQDYTNLTGSARPVPMSVYEVNINVPGGAIAGSQAALTAYTPSLGAGLAVADHMLTALRELKTRDEGLFSLGGYEFQTGTNWAYVWGVTRDMGVTDRRRPAFLACRLANGALGGDLLRTVHAGDDPTWSVTNRNHVTFTNAHHLQSFAFSNGATRALVIFNLHRTDPLTVDFAGPHAPAGTVVWKRLTSGAITDNNEDAEHVRIVQETLADRQPSQALTLPPYSMNVFEWTAPTPQESWRLTNFGTVTNGGDAADGADPDGDGMPNAHEFLAGTDPRSAASALRFGGADAGGLVLPCVTGRHYRVDYTEDLASGVWHELTNGMPGAASALRIPLPPGGAACRFYRAQVLP